MWYHISWDGYKDKEATRLVHVYEFNQEKIYFLNAGVIRVRDCPSPDRSNTLEDAVKAYNKWFSPIIDVDEIKEKMALCELGA